MQILGLLGIYSQVHNRWNEVFFKIMKKPSIVQKKSYLIWTDFDDAVVFVTNSSLLFRFALAILCVRT